jgi:hypothetical protein
MNKTGILVVLIFMAIIGIMCALTSCCTSICDQGAPALRPMPDCGVYVIEDIIEIPVTPSGK